MQQLALAIAAGQVGMQRAIEAAERALPEFGEIARAAMLAHLRAAPMRQASGEDLVDAALAAGAECKDARAFGPVFASLARRGLIRCVRSDLPRKRGHGTSGGKLWRLV